MSGQDIMEVLRLWKGQEVCLRVNDESDEFIGTLLLTDDTLIVANEDRQVEYSQSDLCHVAVYFSGKKLVHVVASDWAMHKAFDLIAAVIIGGSGESHLNDFLN
jgi:hypothetical protein